MKVTFITTVYNRLEYLKNITRCLMNQTYQVNEFIIADDGSHQKVHDYIEELLPECSFNIKHVYQEDLGFRLSRSRNNAAREAENGLLIFCDQDVVFGETYIEEIVRSSKRGTIMPFKVLWSTPEEKKGIQKILDENSAYSEAVSCISKEQKIDRNKQLKKDTIRSFKVKYRLRRDPVTVGGASFALFKEDYLKVNGFNELFKGHGNEDLDFGLRLQRSRVHPKIVKFTEPPIHMAHPQDPTAGSNTDKLKEIKRSPESVKLYCDYGYENTLGEDRYKVNILK